MVSIEQAVFTSARTDRGFGYQIVATSPGVAEADRRELAIWGPSHDSLLETGSEAISVNFFPLPSGLFCLSRTTPVGWEYSGRGGARVYTHCLVVTASLLRQFANHPLALARAATAAGVFPTPAEAPSTLLALDFTAMLPTNHQASPDRLSEPVETRRTAMLMRSVSAAGCTAVACGSVSVEQLVAALLDSLPLEDRTAISFSTGLRYSSRRPFHILPLPSDPATRRRLARQPNVTVLDLESVGA